MRGGSEIKKRCKLTMSDVEEIAQNALDILNMMEAMLHDNPYADNWWRLQEWLKRVRMVGNGFDEVTAEDVLALWDVEHTYRIGYPDDRAKWGVSSSCQEILFFLAAKGLTIDVNILNRLLKEMMASGIQIWSGANTSTLQTPFVYYIEGASKDDE
jgi:hypothetical protein